MSSIYVHVGWEQAFSSKPHRGDIQHYVRRLPKEAAIHALCQLGTTLFNSGSFYMNPPQQCALLETFRDAGEYVERLLQFIAVHQNSIIFTPERVAVLLRYVIMFAEDSDKMPPSDTNDRLLRAILLLNSFYLKPSRAPEPCIFQGTDLAPYIALELDKLIEAHSNFSFVIARYFNFFHWADAQESSSQYYLPVSEDLKSFFGIDYAEYAAAAFTITAAMLTSTPLERWREQPSHVDTRVWLATIPNSAVVHVCLDLLSTSLSDVAQDMHAVPEVIGLGNLRPFIEHPLLRLDEYRFTCPYQGFLRDRFGEALYYALFDRYKENEQHLRFSQFFARFLELHVHNLIEQMLGPRADALGFPEQIYRTSKGESKSSDVIVIAGRTAVFFEVTRSRFRLGETIISADRTSLLEDIDKIFVRKAKELDRSINDFFAGKYLLGSVDPTSIRDVYPVIVTQQDFPQLIALPRMIRQQIYNAGYLRERPTVQILAVDDIEALHQTLDEALPLERLIGEKAMNPACCLRDLATYLRDFHPSMLHHSEGKYIPGYLEFFNSTVVEKLKAWGFEGGPVD